MRGMTGFQIGRKSANDPFCNPAILPFCNALSLIRETSTGVDLDVRVIPRAKKSGLGGERDGALVVRLAAPPVDDAANDALIRFLSDLFQRPRQSFRIASGARNRRKRIAIAGLNAAEARARVIGGLRAVKASARA